MYSDKPSRYWKVRTDQWRKTWLLYSYSSSFKTQAVFMTHLLIWHLLSLPYSCVDPLLLRDPTFCILPTCQWAAQGMRSCRGRKGQRMTLLVVVALQQDLLSTTNPAENHAVTEHSMYCIFSSIMQMNLWFFSYIFSNSQVKKIFKVG